MNRIYFSKLRIALAIFIIFGAFLGCLFQFSPLQASGIFTIQGVGGNLITCGGDGIHAPEDNDCTVCNLCGATDMERTCDAASPCDFHRSTTTWDFNTVNINKSGTGWEWNNEAKTLTLTNLNSATSATTALAVPDGTTIVLNGTNIITSSYAGSLGSFGIHSDGTITVTGSGTLDVTGGSVGIYAAVINISGGRLTAAGANYGVNSTVIFNGGIFAAEGSRAVNGAINTNVSGYRYKMGADSGISYIGSSTPIVNNNSAYIEITTARTATLNMSSAVSFITNASSPQNIILNPGNTNISTGAEGWTWEHAYRILTLHGAYINGNLTVPNGTTIILADGSYNQITGTVPANANITGNGGNGTLNGETPLPAAPSIILSRIGGPFTVGQAIEFEEVYLSYRLLNGIFADSINTADFHAHSVIMPNGVSLGTARRESDTEVRITFVGTPVIANPASASFNGWTNPIPAANFVDADAPVQARTVNNAFLTIPGINKGTGAAISGLPAAASVNYNSITVNALTIPVNPSNQVVQYAISTESGAIPSAGWQTTPVFTGLTERTTYYVYARSMENANRFAGVVQVSAGITTLSSHPIDAAIGNITIEGTRTIAIHQQTATITLVNETVAGNGISNLSANSWFAELPDGINVSAYADEGSNTITLTFTGTPGVILTDYTLTAVFNITIPAIHLTISDIPLPVTANDNARFIISLPPVSARINDVIISGSIGQPISAEATVTIESYTAANFTDTNAADWFSGLPSGITVTVNTPDLNSDTYTFTFSGTPTAVSTSPLTITIPASGMRVGGTPGSTGIRSDTVPDAPFSVTVNPNAIFNILCVNHISNNAKTADCTKPNLCTVCGYEIETGNISHNQGAPATCTTAQVCTLCDYELAAALNHDWSLWVEADGPGEWKRTCGHSGCDAEEYQKFIGGDPDCGHDFSGTVTLVTAAGCTEKGEETIECLYCTATITQSINKTGHTASTLKTIPATCLDNGEEYIDCIVCGLKLSSSIINKLGHDFGTSCSVCGYLPPNANNDNDNGTGNLPNGGDSSNISLIVYEPEIILPQEIPQVITTVFEDNPPTDNTPVQEKFQFIVAELNDTIISAETLQAIAENGTDAMVILPNGFTFIIIADSIKLNAAAFDLDIAVELLNDTATVNNINIPANSIIITPNFVGEFGFDIRFVLTSEQLSEAGINGNNVKLWYISHNGSITETDLIKFNSDNSIEFIINHASYYVLSVQTPTAEETLAEEISAEIDESIIVPPIPANNEIYEDNKINEDNPAIGLLVIFAAVLFAGSIIGIIIKRKHQKR
ncbi:MAG: carbohydrate-binding domain-containing protein [Lachnospiraceae bacterium]|nr:carbohydrate-binding domain-containing protein [Lachnospiraceae bacterium]